MTEPVKQEIGVRLGCSLDLYLFNIFTDSITTAYISEENQQALAAEKQIILTLLLPADDLATHHFPTRFTKRDGSDNEILYSEECKTQS
jgi:hypothetical protein